VLLNTIDRPREAIALGKYLQLRDPMCEVCVFNLARAYRLTGQFEESAHELLKVLSWHAPNDQLYWSIGRSWLLAGDPEKTLAAFENVTFGIAGRELGIILALHDLGRSDDFEARFEQFRIDNNASDIASVYAWIGMNEQAFEWIEKMVAEEGPESLRHVYRDFFRNLQTDPRWPALVKKHGYVENDFDAIEFNFELPAGVTTD
jgi:tetratricopeptide (TPR) repeat protein